MKAKPEERPLGLPELIAIGIGGMIGGGIFSVLGLAVGITGHATPFAFLLGSGIAFAAGYSYVQLALAFRDDGASFTYLERAFPNRPNVAGIAGWTVVVGYVGTMALYAYTFGAYGAQLLGDAGSDGLRRVLTAGVLLFFMFLNLRGARMTGVSEDVIVYAKVTLLLVVALAGIPSVQQDLLLPVFNRGVASVFTAGALIFVAFEGFQLITNAVTETRDPGRMTPTSIYVSILVTSILYMLVSIVAIGNLSVSELAAAKEYALAVAARPMLGETGVVLVCLAALLATASAINATAFGASRLLAQIASEELAPEAFSFRSKAKVPWLAVVSITAQALALALLSDLESIVAFSSTTFLLVSMGVSVANLRLRRRTRSRVSVIVLGLVLMCATLYVMVHYLVGTHPGRFALLIGVYCAIAVAELIFSKRRLLGLGRR